MPHSNLYTTMRLFVQQLLGLCILMVGFWAWFEKDIFNNLSRMTGSVALDPAFILICCGAVTFIIGLTGCIGALRENTCLLTTVCTRYNLNQHDGMCDKIYLS